MTQEELAEKVNITREHLGRLDRGKYGCSIDLHIELYYTLNASTDYLLLGRNPDRDLLIWQRPYENGTWERRAESGTEANYDMVDGRVNNSEALSSGERGGYTNHHKKARKRKSVIRKLRRKQREIARNSGRYVPVFLQEDREERRINK